MPHAPVKPPPLALADLRGSEWARAETFPVPAAAKGSWCVIRSTTTDGGKNVRHMLSFRNAAGDSVGARPFFRRDRSRGGTYRTVAYVPGDADTYQVHLFSPDRSITAAPLRFRPVSRASSALLLLGARPSAAARLARLAMSGQFRRVRTLLNALAGSVTTPSDYAEWIELFDTWPVTAPPAARTGITIGTLVFSRAPGRTAALQATLDSLAAQGQPTAATVLHGPGSTSWREQAAALSGDYLAVLQAGEVVPPHAIWFAAHELQRLGRPTLAFADEDSISDEGRRSLPLFRPEPGPALMMSGTQSRGVWFVRRDVLGWGDDMPDAEWAECLRLGLWLRGAEHGATDTKRIPVVLTHRRPDTESAPPDLLAALVNEHLGRVHLPLRAEAASPIRLHATPVPARPVAMVVPSTLRNPLATRCLLSVLRTTAHQNFQLLVGVSQPGPLDTAQQEAAARITADPRARVVHLARDSFNFSAVCNALARDTSGEFVLLLNDDVSPLEPAWLDEMSAHLADPGVGVVGAKLLYPDHTVQHGGVIIGLAGLCDHAHRGLPGTAPGYAGRAVVSQDLSAVTAACLLVRRSIYDQLGGLDEAYPSAFNDIDFCLRVREAGHRIVFAPAATLLHHEMATYGSHYSGDRAPFEADEISRMQRRWAELIANDPYHSPNLDLGTGREWQLAFPPRRPRQFQL